jgi:hypothetical protein
MAPFAFSTMNSIIEPSSLSKLYRKAEQHLEEIIFSFIRRENDMEFILCDWEKAK